MYGTLGEVLGGNREGKSVLSFALFAFKAMPLEAMPFDWSAVCNEASPGTKGNLIIHLVSKATLAYIILYCTTLYHTTLYYIMLFYIIL